MPIISKKELVAKNKAGNGIRNNDTGNNRQNNAAVKRLAEILLKAADIVRDTDEAVADGYKYYGDSLNTMATTAINQNNDGKISRALKALDGFEGSLRYNDATLGKTNYDYIVSILPQAGSSKQEFDGLLRTANGVFELGLEKTVLKPVDPREQERIRQEQERARREQETLRREQERIEAEERQRREQERQRREQEERARRYEEERQREAVRRRAEQERLRQEQERLRREQEEQRKQQRVQELKNEREAFLREDYDNTDYADPDVAPLKIEPDYKQKQDAMEEAAAVLENDRILDGEKERFRRRLNDEPLERRKQMKEEAALLNEDEAKREGPLVQTKAQFVAEPVPEDAGLDLPERFRKIWDEDGIESARDADGNVYDDKEAVLNALGKPGARFLLYGKDREYGLALENREGKLFATEKSPEMELGADEVLADRLPEKTVDGKPYILNWKEDEIAYATDADGKRYDGPDKVRIALYGTDKKLLLYTKGEELPFMVEKRNNRFYATDERIQDLKHLDGGLFRSTDVTAKDFLGKHWQVGEQSAAEKAVTEITGADFFAKEKIDFAVDADGNVFRGADKIAAELDKKGDRTLFLFEQNGELPYAIRKEDGRFLKSDGRIGTRNILPETAEFEPKKTLKADDLGGRKDATDYFALKDRKDDAGKIKKFYEKEITRIDGIRNEGRPLAPKTPVRPRLGKWNTFVRRLKKIVTFGRGETEAYRIYTTRKNRYRQDMESLPERQKAYEAKKKIYEDIEKNGDTMIAEARGMIDKANSKLRDINAKMGAAAAGLDKHAMDAAMRKVNSYRGRVEAKLEGVQDLRKTGRVTPDNIFANTWLREAECKGKPASDPAARKALYRFIASDTIQSDILDRRFRGADKKAVTSDALDERSVEPLNTGAAEAALAKDEDLKNLLDSMGDGAIDPRRIKDRYVSIVADRTKEAGRDINVLKGAKADMERAFGKQEPTEQAFDEIMRYMNVLREINNDGTRVRYKNAKEALADTFAMKPTEEDKKRFREAFDEMKAEKKGPMTLEEMNTRLNEKTVAIEERKEAEAAGPQPHL